MKKIFKFLSFLTLLTLLFLIAGCAPPYRAVVTYKVRPEVDIGIRRIAIIPLDEQYSRKISNMLISSLSEMKYFEILERQKLDAILQEMRLSSWGLVDIEKAVEFGKLAGVEGIVLVSLDDLNIKDVRGEELYYIPSKKYSDVTYRVIVPTITRQAYLSCSFRVISVATSQIIVSRTFSQKFEETYYQAPLLYGVPDDEVKDVISRLPYAVRKSEPPKAEGEIFNDLSQKIVTSIVKTISPYFVKYIVNWEDLKVKEQERIISLLKADLVKDALEEMLKLRSVIEAKKDKKLLASYYYDLGIIYEILGDLNSAKDCYMQALNLDPTNNHINTVKRINQLIETLAK
ncbi:MAG: hypothetical protein CBR30_09480 [Dictyoglomus sp. NZ13-RE01]|nr:MAG: hypothetical protein CBR30_09480 [Dictyoglomus sp. NZ13-RE01]